MGGFLFPKSPDRVVTPAPTKNDADVQKAAADARLQARLRRGRSSTIATGMQGDTSNPQILYKKLLGE